MKKHLTPNRENPGEQSAAVPQLACICFHSLFVCLLRVFAPAVQTFRVMRKVQGVRRGYGHDKKQETVRRTQLWISGPISSVI